MTSAPTPSKPRSKTFLFQGPRRDSLEQGFVAEAARAAVRDYLFQAELKAGDAMRDTIRKAAESGALGITVEVGFHFNVTVTGGTPCTSDQSKT